MPTDPSESTALRSLSVDDIARLTPVERLELVRAVTSYRGFQLAYREYPAAFVSDCFGWANTERPKPYQLDILHQLPFHRMCVRAPHGVGKTTLAAWALLWFALTRDGTDWKVVVTASVWRQLKEFFWPEVRKWASRVEWQRIGRPPFNRDELQHMALKLRTGAAITVASDSPAHIEGAHADALLYIFDEAKAIRDEMFDAAEGAFANLGQKEREAFALAISTPGPPIGRFHAIQTRRPGYEHWTTRHIGAREAIDAGQMTQQWIEDCGRMWGIESQVYINRVEGNFAADDRNGIIPLSWVEAAIERWKEYASVIPESVRRKRVSVIGADIARGGTDRNVMVTLIEADGLTVINEIRRTRHSQDTRATLSDLQSLADVSHAAIVIDVIGFGAALYDELKEKEYSAYPFNAAAGCDARDHSGELRFGNLRAAAWWRLRDRLNPNSKLKPLALPPDDYLIGDLTAPRWENRTSGIQVESKDRIRQRLGRSTDVGDAVVHALAKDLVRTEVFFY